MIYLARHTTDGAPQSFCSTLRLEFQDQQRSVQPLNLLLLMWLGQSKQVPGFEQGII